MFASLRHWLLQCWYGGLMGEVVEMADMEATHRWTTIYHQFLRLIYLLPFSNVQLARNRLPSTPNMVAFLWRPTDH